MEEKLSPVIKILILIPIFVLALLLFMMATLNTIGAGDTWWYLSCGRYIVENFTVPHTEVFSYTFYGKPWLNSEWLTNVLFYIIFSNFGREGLAVYKVILVIVILSLVVLRAYLKTGDYYLSIMCLLFITFVGRVYLDIRAQLATFLFINICLLLIDFYYKKGNKWLLFIIPLMVLPWVNLHGGFMYVFFILGSYWLGEFLKIIFSWFSCILFPRYKEDKPGKKKKTSPQKAESLVYTIFQNRDLKLFFILSIICFAVGLINPYGIMVYEFPFIIIYMPGFKTLEWLSPLNFTVDAFTTPLYPYYCIFFVILSLFNRKASPGEQVLCWLSLLMSLNSRRFIPLFVFVSIPLILESVSFLIKKKLQELPVVRVVFQFLLFFISFILIYVLMLNIFPAVQASHGPFNYMTADYTFPESACEFLKKNNIYGKMFNYYNWGGYIMWHLYPEMKIFIDGRAHGVYSEKYYLNYIALCSTSNHEYIQQNMDFYDVDIILTSKFSQQKFVETIWKTDKWYLLYHDYNSFILLRKNKQNQIYMEKMKKGDLYIPPQKKPAWM